MSDDILWKESFDIQSWEDKHFPDQELACQGQCILCVHEEEIPPMHPVTMERLVKMRKDLDFPFPISSAWRCPKHNNNVSSTGLAGPHVTGRAVDIRVYGYRAYMIISNAYSYGFTGIGVSQRGPRASRFIHLDDLESDVSGPRPWVWSY